MIGVCVPCTAGVYSSARRVVWAFVSSPGPTFRAYKCVPGRQCYVITYTGRPPATHAWAMCDGVDTETLRTRAPRVWQCIVFAARNKGGSMPCSPRKRNAPESPRGALSPKRQSGLADLAGLERSASESEQASASGSRSLSPIRFVRVGRLFVSLFFILS